MGRSGRIHPLCLFIQYAYQNLLKTFGANFESDGRLSGDLDVKTIPCDTNANTCQVQVPAPGFALVFLTDSAFSEVTPQNQQTFSTTSLTRTAHTATVDPSILATSNGHSGSDRDKDGYGSTSKGSANGARAVAIPGVAALIAMICGAMAVRRVLTR